MTVTITLTAAGTDTGPFLLYSDTDGFTSPFETGVPKASLEAGYISTLVPDGTTSIRVMSAGVCTNYIDISVTTTTTTTTIGPTILDWIWSETGNVTSGLYIQDTNTLSYLVNKKLDISTSGSVTVPIATYNISIFWNGGDPQPIKFRL